jgi:hypothetical protein
MPIFITVSGMQYERLLCAGFDFSWFSIKLISFLVLVCGFNKNLFGFESSKKPVVFSACPKTLSNQFPIQA